MKQQAILQIIACLLILASSHYIVSKVCGQTENPEQQNKHTQNSQVSSEAPKTLPPSFYENYKNAKVSLLIRDITSLPGGEVFLGGSYHGGGNTIHSVLLVSRDEGHTWKDTGLKFPGCSIMNFQTVGRNHVWAISTFTQEGCRGPESLLHSSDAGHNWSSVPMDFETMGGLEWIQQFEFFDDRHGLLIMTRDAGICRIHTTFDGGKSWKTLMTSHLNNMSEVIEPTCPSNCTQKFKEATLWKKQTEYNYYKISDWIRVQIWDINNDPYIVLESQGVDRKGWTQISQIPRYYKVEKDHIVPIENNKTPGTRGDLD